MTTIEIIPSIYYNDEPIDYCIPKKGRNPDACYDLSWSGAYGSVNDELTIEGWLVVRPGQQILVDAGFRMNIPEGYAAFIWPRSGLAVNKRIDTRAGVIDAGYQGPIKVLLDNDHPTDTFVIKPGDRIAQMAFQRVPEISFEVVEAFSTETERGEAGFGSSGR